MQKGMADAQKICRICLSFDVRMFTLKNTNMENLYKLLTEVYVDIGGGKPATVCFLCHARLQQCDKLQQQAIKSNKLLEELLVDGIMQATGNTILNNQYTSQDLQVSSMCHIDLQPATYNIEVEADSLISIKEEKEAMDEGHNVTDLDLEPEPTCKDDFLYPIVEANSLISIKKEKEAIDEGYDVTDFPENGKDSIDFDSEVYYSDPDDKQLLTAIGSIEHDVIKDIDHGKKRCKQQEIENLCIIPEEEVNNQCFLLNSTQMQEKYNISNNNEEVTEIHWRPEIKQEKSKSTVNCIKTIDTLVSDNQLIKKDLKSLLSEIYRCDICTFETNQKLLIETHLKMHNGTKVFSCNICEYRCAQNSELELHLMKHTDKTPFSCNVCEYKCAHRHTLKNHMRTHTGEKPFSCIICEYRCAQKHYLKDHMRTHTGEKPFSCNICEYRCARKGHLKTHMNKHTSEKPYSCNICEYRCSQKGQLKQHIAKHTGKIPFSCKICEFRCALKGDLKRHIRTHTGEKPFSCNICEYRSAQEGQLRQHMKKKHKG